MSLRVTQVVLGLSLLLNAFVLAGFFFHRWIEPPPLPANAGPPGPPGQGGRWPNPLELLAKDLKLDDAQMKVVQPIIDDYGNTRREGWRGIGKVREEMAGELQKPSFDWTKIDGLVDRMTVLRAEQEKQTLRMVEQFATKLPADKQAELHKLLGERFGGPWRRGGAPGGPGGPGGPRPPRPPQ
jgi:Spy/CpxP family protein refolding chaperone